MIRIRVRTNVVDETLIKPVTVTPTEIFDELGVDITGKSVNISGRNLVSTEVNDTFAELGFEDGKDYTMHCIVKADGGRN